MTEALRKAAQRYVDARESLDMVNKRIHPQTWANLDEDADKALNDLRAALAAPEPAEPTQEQALQSVECISADRYRVFRSAFWWKVAIGDGQQTVGRCYTKDEAEVLAAALRAAFLDGAFIAAGRASKEGS